MSLLVLCSHTCDEIKMIEFVGGMNSVAMQWQKMTHPPYMELWKQNDYSELSKFGVRYIFIYVSATISVWVQVASGMEFNLDFSSLLLPYNLEIDGTLQTLKELLNRKLV